MRVKRKEDGNERRVKGLPEKRKEKKKKKIKSKKNLK